MQITSMPSTSTFSSGHLGSQMPLHLDNQMTLTLTDTERRKSRCFAVSSLLITFNMPHATWHERTAQLLSLIDLEWHFLSFIHWLKLLTDEEGEETECPEQNPDSEDGGLLALK